MKKYAVSYVAKAALIISSAATLTACETVNSNANWKVASCLSQFASYANAEDKKAMFSGEYSYKEDRCHVATGHATQADANRAAQGQCYRQDAVNDPLRCTPIVEGMRLSPLAVQAMLNNPNGGPELLTKLRQIGYK